MADTPGAVRERMLAKRVLASGPSASFAVIARARALAAEGADVIVVAGGEPKFGYAQDSLDAVLFLLSPWAAVM